MTNTTANSARVLDLAVWDLEDLISAYEYRANPYTFTNDQIEEAINSGELDIQAIYEEATTNLEAGVSSTTINRTVVTDPITNYQSVEVNVKYEVPVNNVVCWDVNLTVDFLTGETTNHIGGTITLQQDGETYDSIDFGDNGDCGDSDGGNNGNGNGGDGNNGHGNDEGGIDPSNPGNGPKNRSFEIAPRNFETVAPVVEVQPAELDIVQMMAPQQIEA